MDKSKFLVLASQSPYRQMLLKQVGIPFKAHPAQVDERQLESNFDGPIEKVAEHLSFKKAESLLSLFPDRPIVGSDQVLIFNGQTFPKPETKQDVIDRLKEMQGKTHQLSTGICLLYQGREYRNTVTADLKMHPLTESEIESYFNLDQPLGCAGGYMIEKHGPLLFESIQTKDHHSIIGLPILTLVSYLRETGIFRL